MNESVYQQKSSSPLQYARHYKYKWCYVLIFKNVLWNQSFVAVFGRTKKTFIFFKTWYLFLDEIFQASLPSYSTQDPPAPHTSLADGLFFPTEHFQYVEPPPPKAAQPLTCHVLLSTGLALRLYESMLLMDRG